MDKEEINLIQQYRRWRLNSFNNKLGFFPIFSNFESKLTNMSSGSITLYIFLGLHSNYNNGTSFYSINKLSIIFNKSSKTISNWIKELENNNLIYRKQKRLNSVSTTYLLPYKNDEEI